MASPMRKVALRNLAAHKVRLALTLLSVVLGTAFIAGSFVFTDTLQRSFDDIFANQAVGVDVRVEPKERQSLGIPNEVVDKIAAMDQVRTVAPSVSGAVVLLKPDGKAVQTGGAPTIGTSYLPPDKAVAKPDVYLAGGPPTATDEISINEGGANRAGLHVGDKTKVLIPRVGNKDVTVTGIYDFAANSGGFINIQFTDAQARELFTDKTHVAFVDIAVKPGVAANDLRDTLAKAYPDYKVQNGDQVREDLKKQLADQLKFLNYFLLAFGGIAVIVGSSIIYNTFSMLIAQRLRELALLRAVGASRGQIGRSVVGEALLIGLAGSVLGLFVGVGLAYGISAVMNAQGAGLPMGSMSVEPRTVVVALLLGVTVTVVSAYVPALRAATIPPIEAMREVFGASTEVKRLGSVTGGLVTLFEKLRLPGVARALRAVLTSKYLRPGFGALLAVVGLVLVVAGARSTGGDAAATVGIGALALIFAVLLVGPALSGPMVGALGVLTKPFGPVGRMALNNAKRNPTRTAATAFALTLGVMLVSAIGMLGSSAKASITELVDKGVKADYILAGPQNSFIGVPLGAGPAVAKVPGVEDVVPFHAVVVKVGSDQLIGTVPEGDVRKVLKYDMAQGTDQLGDNGIMVSETEAADRNWKIGDTVELTSVDKAKKIPVVVDGIYKDTQLFGPLVAPMALYDQVKSVAFETNTLVLLTTEKGADQTAVRAGLEQAVDSYAIVQVMDREDFKGAQGKQINTMLVILYALLALAVVIAILGIVNTLALSVVERRREIGMLRAVGMQRPQVRRTIYLESMLIAVFGALIGVVLGLFLGTGFLRTLRDLGLTQIAVPWVQIVFMVLASAVVGVLAALWPGIRAARTPPLAAIAEV
ncbi:ABC transporter permease [Nocardia yamanashiensis]|uniref:ABC transporter permease n=1 Tax=Nocardia yamanashiensis TaxID=209247 RepID=UPI0008334DE0|nr:FtsX-like permease family protein [Nocardia yamanashiensis]